MAGRTLRPYRPADRSACLALFDGHMPTSFLPDERPDFVAWLDALDAPSGEEHAEYAVLEDGGRVVACGGIWWRGEQAGFAWGMVARDLQRRGYGTALVRARVDRLRALGVPGVRLDTTPHTAPYYARFGFHEVARTPDGYGPGVDRVDMVLALGGRANPRPGGPRR